MDNANGIAVDDLFRYDTHAPAVAALLAAEFGTEARIWMFVAQSIGTSPYADVNSGGEWEHTVESLARRAAHFAIMALDGGK